MKDEQRRKKVKEPKIYSGLKGLKYADIMGLILLIALAYSSAILQGTTFKIKSVKKYIVRHNEPKRKYQRRSTFGSGLDGQQWLTYLDKYASDVQELVVLQKQ
jgi:hypothetical protein